MLRISTKFKNRQNEIAITAACIIENMQDNEHFPDPPPALAELKSVLPEFNRALAEALGRDKKMMAIKDDKKAIVLGLLLELVDYVTETSKGDRTMILSSGFHVIGENGNGNRRPSIEKLEVELGPSGEAITRIKNVTGAIAFVHQYTTEPPNLKTIWVSEGSSLGSYTFEGLNSEKRHWFRVVAIGYFGQRGYSPVVTRVIQ